MLSRINRIIKTNPNAESLNNAIEESQIDASEREARLPQTSAQSMKLPVNRKTGKYLMSARLEQIRKSRAHALNSEVVKASAEQNQTVAISTPEVSVIGTVDDPVSFISEKLSNLHISPEEERNTSAARHLVRRLPTMRGMAEKATSPSNKLTKLQLAKTALLNTTQENKESEPNMDLQENALDHRNNNEYCDNSSQQHLNANFDVKDKVQCKEWCHIAITKAESYNDVYSHQNIELNITDNDWSSTDDLQHNVTNDEWCSTNQFIESDMSIEKERCSSDTNSCENDDPNVNLNTKYILDDEWHVICDDDRVNNLNLPGKSKEENLGRGNHTGDESEIPVFSVNVIEVESVKSPLEKWNNFHKNYLDWSNTDISPPYSKKTIGEQQFPSWFKDVLPASSPRQQVTPKSSITRQKPRRCNLTKEALYSFEVLNDNYRPVQLLNDWCVVKPRYSVAQEMGPPHDPLFTIRVTLSGVAGPFVGRGASKNLAKHAAALAALRFAYEDDIIDLEDVEDGDHGSTGKRKKTEDLVNTKGVNAIMVLNEVRSGLKYKVLKQDGPSHCPMFTMSVEVDGRTYTAQGRSKKEAKYKAAEAALQSFIQIPMNIKVAPTPNHDTNVDFTVDNFELGVAKPVKNPSKVAAPDKNDRNSAMLINELYPHSKFEFTENVNDSYARFTAKCTVEDQVFTGTGSNKKLAKLAASTIALTKLMNIQTPRPNMPKIVNLVNQQEQDLVDKVGCMVNETFSRAMERDATHAKRKVLAGIVLTRPAPTTTTTQNSASSQQQAAATPPSTTMQVIAVTTGTKCVSGEYISMRGAVLNDMHAEILARRALHVFLYEQLALLEQERTRDQSVLEPRGGGKGGYRLRAGHAFHLYINTAPCGDARIFSPHEDAADIDDRHPNRASRGQLRTKIESGEGTVPIKGAPQPPETENERNGGGVGRGDIYKEEKIPVVQQTWDGVMQGERLLTMSCSDKVARWNVMGVQGALLSYFIEPIYFTTIILGSLFHPTHFERAMYGRYEMKLQGLPPPYRLHRPKLRLVTSIETRIATKAPSFAVNWLANGGTSEVVNTTTGRPLDSSQSESRLSKRAMLNRFCQLATNAQLRPLTPIPFVGGSVGLRGVSRPSHPPTLCYADVKAAANAYQTAKACLGAAFYRAGLGCWVKKPIEEDQFEVTYGRTE